MRPTSLFLMRFFLLLRSRSIAHCVVGDTRSLPDQMGDGVAVIVPRAAIDKMAEIIDEFCGLNRLRLIQCVPHENTGYVFSLVLRNTQGNHDFLSLDIRGDQTSRGRRFLAADEILNHASNALDASGHDRGFTVAAPAYEFCYSLIGKIEKEELDSRQCTHLTRQWRLDAAGSKKLIHRFWGHTVEARRLTRAAESGDWTAVAKLLPRMRVALRRRNSRLPAIL